MIRQLNATCVAVLGMATMGDAGQQQWQRLGLCGGGGMYNPVVSPHDPNMMMLESDMSGRYISRDGGRSWTMVHHDQITSAVRGGPPVFHPTRPGVVHALRGYRANTLLTSTDNGVTWTRWPDESQLPSATDVVTRMFIDPAMPERLFVGAADGEVLFTDDQGKAWRRARGISGRAHRFVVDRGSPPPV